MKHLLILAATLATVSSAAYAQDRLWKASDSPLPSDDVTDVITSGSTAWVATAQGVARIVNDTGWTVWKSTNGLPSNSVRALALQSDGSVWAATEGGIGLLRTNDTWNSWRTPQLPSNNIKSITVANDGAAWACSPTAVMRFNGTGWTSFTAADGLPSGSFTCIAAIGSDIWVGTEGGTLGRRSNGQWSVLSTAETGLPAQPVMHIAPVPGGAAFSTWGGGIALRSTAGAWTFQSSASHRLPYDYVAEVVASASCGQLYAAMRLNGVAIRGSQEWRSKNFTLPAENCRALAFDARGRCWVATAGGVAVRAIQPTVQNIQIAEQRVCGQSTLSLVLEVDDAPQNPQAVNFLLSDPSGNFTGEQIIATRQLDCGSSALSIQLPPSLNPGGAYAIRTRWGTSTSAPSNSFELLASPALSVNTGTTALCPGDSAVIATDDGADALWDDGTTAARRVVYAPGTYSAERTSSEGCKTVATVSVTARQPVTLQLQSTIQLCSAAVQQLFPTTDAQQLEWFPAYLVDSPTSPAPELRADSTEWLYVRAQSQGRCDALDSILVVVLPAPEKPVVDYADSALQCTGEYAFYQWFLNDFPISGATGPTHTPDRDGEYYVFVRNEEGCENRSDALLVRLSSIHESHPQATAALPHAIYDITGRLIATGPQAQAAVEHRKIPPGSYFVIRTDGTTALLLIP